MKNIKSNAFVLVVFASMSLAATQPLQAAVSLTVHATANGDNLGYVKDQSYSFTWTLNDTASNMPLSNFSGGHCQWYAEQTNEDSPFSNLSGTGFTGPYVRPALYPTDPWEMLTVSTVAGTDELSVYVASDFGDGLGVTTPDATPINAISFGLKSPEFAFTFSGAWSNPSDYFEAFIGTYSIEGYFGIGSRTFTPTSLEIADVSAVPETATTLPTMALVAGGLLIRRRSFGRRK